MALQLGWIGLGNMGRGMTRNLASKGDLDKPLIIYNRTAKRAYDHQSELGPDRATVSESLPDLVKAANIIFMCLGDDKAVTETIDAAIQSGHASGKVFVDCSTVHPTTSNAVATKLEAAGAHFVACPVFGVAAMANAGQLICVLAGKAEYTAKIRPFTKGVIGRAVIDFSDEPHGQATLLKIVGNTFIFQMVEALSLGHTLAETSGLGVEHLHSFIELMFPGPYAAYSKRMIQGDYYGHEAPLLPVDLARKDVRHAMDLAAKDGFRLKAMEVADEHLVAVKSEEGPKGDLAGMYGAVRKEAGLPFENGKKQ